MTQFTWTYNGNEHCTDPYKIMQPNTPGISEDQAGKKFYELLGMSDAEGLQVHNDMQWSTIREERDSRIQQTDWTQNADVPNATKTKWQTYRQSLRDITTQSDPFNVTWPTPPS